MWIACRYGWISLACARKDGGRSHEVDPDTMMLRARCREHLESLRRKFDALAEYRVTETPRIDYRWRLVCPKDVAAHVVAGLVTEMEWSNFKSEAARFQRDEGFPEADLYIDALHEVWSVMRDLQD